MALVIKEENGKIYSFLRDKWLIETPEEKVRQEFVCTLVNNFGYSLNQMAEEMQVNNSHRGQGKARADIVIWKSEEDKINSSYAFIVVECKAENIKIHVEDYYQGLNYASWMHAPFFVVTNNKETKFFNIDDKKAPHVINDNMEIVTIPLAKDVNNDKKIKDILSQTKKFTRDEFTSLLQKCHNIIRNNDKLSPEAAFDEISKILFIKINFERKLMKTKQIYTLNKYIQDRDSYEQMIRPALRLQQDQDYMQYLFDTTKENYKNDHLFEDNEKINIRENSFMAILKELQKYNLSDTSDDVKGIAFEQFLGRTFRGELGQFFTPRTIVDFMTELLDPQEGELICDPCCGSGGFLIRVFEYIKEKIEKDIQKTKEKIKSKYIDDNYETLSEKEQLNINEKLETIFTKLNKELEHVYNGKYGSFKSRLDKLSYDSIYGTDANPRMARTSKMNMIMHGDGHGGVHHHDGLINVNGIFNNRFDVILTNPPFGASVSKTQKIDFSDIDNNEERINYYTQLYGKDYLSQLEDLKRRVNGITKDGKKEEKEKLVLNLFETGKMSGLTEVLFIERCLNLLKPGGRMGIVLPEGVLNNSNLQKVRDFVESKAKIIMICSIPQDVFIKAGATVKPSLLFFKKFTLEEEQEYKQIKLNAQQEIENKFREDLQQLKDQKENKEITTKDYNKKIKELNLTIEDNIKQIIKTKFDYEIPIAKVDKAGITTTGAPCENQLIDVLKEFKNYEKENILWENNSNTVEYCINDLQNLERITKFSNNLDKIEKVDL